jgi:hypothetical protein
MKIVDMFWTSRVNYYKIRCDCGNEFPQRVDRFTIVCSKCKRRSHKETIDIELEKKNGKNIQNKG